jgi:hypothetical protein
MYYHSRPLPVFDPQVSITDNAEVLYVALEMVPGWILRRYWKFSTSEKTNHSQFLDVTSTVEPLVLLLHFFQEIRDYPGVDTARLKQFLHDYFWADVVASPGHELSKHVSRLLVSKNVYFCLKTIDEKPQPRNMCHW